MHIPEEVRVGWESRLSELSDRTELALPHASATALVLTGQAPRGSFMQRQFNAETIKAIEWLIRQAPNEFPLDVAAARCRQLDSYFYDEYRRQTRDAVPVPRVLETTLVSTDKMVSYLSPNLKLAWHWPWESVTDLTITKRGSRLLPNVARIDRVELIDNTDRRYKISLGSMALENLLAIYQWATEGV